jgi:hypothetical protein
MAPISVRKRKRSVLSTPAARTQPHGQHHDHSYRDGQVNGRCIQARIAFEETDDIKERNSDFRKLQKKQ